jgi:NDP-sugar pyrophosphorylase family protein
MQPTLLVLAAGMGSRYGSLKQLDPVGPSGETILDYAVFDAVRAGFGKVVFVIRRDFEDAFKTRVAAKYEGKIPLGFVYQAIDSLPPGFSSPAGRQKPWGTGHAVWCARDVVKEPFAVVGADDFFGRDAFEKLAGFLGRTNAVPSEDKAGKSRQQYCMVGYRLDRTLSEHGTVSRGICSVGADGRLQSILERTSISAVEIGRGDLRGDETVSMNCFGFVPSLFPPLDEQLCVFLKAHGSEEKAEFYLPAAVSHTLSSGKAEVHVLPTTGTWFGVTNKEDRPRVVAALAELVRRGEYPDRLF